ncbi:hypothetical protein [Lichenibacterium dinghuense]|uniref:hypothetical protein n=1 Tax=Lichenibacterium dinghuense TaxID=2895977 RepID=UPI001F415E2C|nr:hypothetical protein [Lichenibacterium sp. 6Y81]
MEAFEMTPHHDAIRTEIEAAEAAVERYDHVTEASAAVIDRARAAVEAAIEADMPPRFFVNLRVYLSIYNAPARAAESRARFGG